MSSTTTDAGSTVDAAASGEAGAGAEDSSTADAGADAKLPGEGVERLRDSDFENGSCGDWTPKQSGFTDLATPTKTGVHACKVCGGGTTNYWSVSQAIPTSVLVDGATYEASIYVRVPSTGPVPGELHFGTDYDVTQPGDESGALALNPEADGWTHFTKRMVYDASLHSSEIEFELIDRNSYNGCMIVDSASFTRVAP